MKQLQFNLGENKILKYILYGSILSLLIYIATYVIVLNSLAFEVAENYTRENKELIEEIGEIENVSLSPFRFSIKHTGSSGIASFRLIVDGANKSKYVYIQLIKKRGTWVAPTQPIGKSAGKGKEKGDGGIIF